MTPAGRSRRAGGAHPDRRATVSGYCAVMAPRRPVRAAEPAATELTERYDPVAEQEASRRARARRDAAATPAERLERLHRLCAQLATLIPARPPDGQ